MMKINHLRSFNRTGGPFSAILIFAVMFSAFSSCTATKHSEYFKTLQQKDTTIKNFVSNDFESRIVKGDRLSVTATSLNPNEDLLFNSGAGDSKDATGGYIVQPDGTIFLHRLGKMPVEGLTRTELAAKTEKLLLAYMKEPIVQVAYLNHKVTIIGEINKPGILNLPEEQITLLDALVLSGDLTANAKRNNITIIREEGNDKRVKHVNMEDNSIFTSPWYYVKPNDIILVSIDYEKTEKADKRTRLQSTLSLVASGFGLLIIVLDRVIKNN